ncbi:MAG TPA: hypothetical protein VGG78_04780 [Gemmatimonadaceae bacterium]
MGAVAVPIDWHHDDSWRNVPVATCEDVAERRLDLLARGGKDRSARPRLVDQTGDHVSIQVVRSVERVRVIGHAGQTQVQCGTLYGRRGSCGASAVRLQSALLLGVRMSITHQ